MSDAYANLTAASCQRPGVPLTAIKPGEEKAQDIRVGYLVCNAQKGDVTS